MQRQSLGGVAFFGFCTLIVHEVSSSPFYISCVLRGLIKASLTSHMGVHVGTLAQLRVTVVKYVDLIGGVALRLFPSVNLGFLSETICCRSVRPPAGKKQANDVH